MINVMVDLETMGTSATAPIISIGAVFFDEDGLGKEFYAAVSLEDSVKRGGVIDPSTVIWWMQQEESLLGQFVAEQKLGGAVKLPTALERFTEFVTSECSDRELRVWGNGASFDNVILRNAFEVCGLIEPWRFWNDRCFRTIKSLFGNVPYKQPKVAHNALSDAVAQAEHMVMLTKKGHL